MKGNFKSANGYTLIEMLVIGANRLAQAEAAWTPRSITHHFSRITFPIASLNADYPKRHIGGNVC